MTKIYNEAYIYESDNITLPIIGNSSRILSQTYQLITGESKISKYRASLVTQVQVLKPQISVAG